MGGDIGDQEPGLDGRTGALIREMAAVHGKGRCGMNDSDVSGLLTDPL